MRIQRKRRGDYNCAKHGVTQGWLQSWLACRQKTRYYSELWSSLKESRNFWYGGVVHEALERLHKMGEVPNDEDVKQIVEDCMATLYEELEKGRAKKDDMEAAELLHVNVEVVVSAYVNHWSEDWSDRNHWVETEFEFNIDVEGVPLRGKIDGIVRRGKGNDNWWVFETKTRSQISDDLPRQLAVDFQSQVYQYAVARTYDTVPKGVYYNIVRNPGLKLGSKTLPEHRERLAEDIEKRPDWYFRRFEIIGDPSDNKDFVNDLKKIIQEYKLWCQGLRPCYRNRGACYSGGFFSCAYLDACISGNMIGYYKRDRLFPELESD